MNRLILAFALLLAPALQGCATAADAAHCRGSNGRFIKCPAPPPPTQTCPDGTIILATAICPAPASPPATVWTKCADENGTCTTTGNVRYGFGLIWTPPRAVTGSIACNNATWGDPIVGTVKECDTDGIVAPAPVPAPTPSPVPSGTWVAAPLTVGGYAKATAAEQAVPKGSPYAYGEAVYRTVQAGEVVKLGARLPDVACSCVGQQRQWVVFGLDGRFIGYLWEANLSGVAPAP